MAATEPTKGWRRTLLLAGLVFAVVTILTSVVAIAWSRDMRAPRVVLLGSGRRVSALVTAGDARLLIATGNDRTAFHNALELARHPTTRRIDVLLVAGQGDDLVAPAGIRHDRRIRYAASLGPLPDAAAANAVAGDGLPVLPSPREIRLDDDVRVTLETVAPAPDEAGGGLAWRAVIRRNASVVVIVSDGAAATRFPAVGPVAALVVAGQDPLTGWEAIPAPVLAVSGEGGVTGKTLRQGADRLFDDQRWVIQVHPGEAIGLDFVEGGVRIAGGAAQAVAATPAPTDDRS
jgi:hypothetical protein